MFSRNVLKRQVPLWAGASKSPKLPKYTASILPPTSIRTLTTARVSAISFGAHRFQCRSKKFRYFNGPNTKSLKPSSSVATPLSGQYDPFLVNVALFTVVANKYGHTMPPEVLQALQHHFDANPDKVAALADSIYSFHFSKLRPHRRSEIVPHVVVNMFRAYFDSVAVLTGADPFQETVSSVSRSMIPPPFLSLVELLLVYGQKRKVFMDLYCKGVGTLLPELQTLTREFDFGALSSISPVLNKISGLVSEFGAFIDENGDIHRYDANALRLFVNVLRYQRLYGALISRSSDSSLAADLLAISKDPDAVEIQTQLGSLSGDQREIDNLVFSVNRNFFNAIYVSTGLVNFDSIFAFLNREAQKECYTTTEKTMIHDFVESFLPLVCNGLLPIDAMSEVKYACLPARYEDDIIVPFKFSDNMFDNYELSLAILFQVPSKVHLIRLVKPDGFLSSNPLTLDMLLTSIREYFASSSYLLKADSQELIRILTEMNNYLLRGTTILKKLALDPKLNLVAQNQISLCSTVETMKPSIEDLSKELETESTPITSTKRIRINDHEITDYKTELKNFRLIDLNNEKFVDIGLKAFLKYLEERMRYVASGKHLREPSAVTPENVELFVQLYEVLAASYDVGLSLEFQLDTLADEALDQATPEPSSSRYVQIPDDLKLHDLHSELEIFRNDELKCLYASLTADQIIDRLQRLTDALMKENDTAERQSRMTLENVLWFKKLLSRLKLLFAMNGGNTQVLDALIQSQDVFAQLESKIKSKKKVQATEAVPLQELKPSRVPYSQIPEDLHLHDYVSELIEFREKDLSSEYKDCSPEKIILTLKKRTDELIKGVPSSNPQLAITNDNFRVYVTLLSKLNKLFILNGGYTAILDTMIQSQSAFERFESSLSEKGTCMVNKLDKKKTIYSEIPEEVILEDYYQEISELKSKLGLPFGSTNVDSILRSLDSMINETSDVEKKVVLGKLNINLRKLFKLNNDHTFILDNVLLSAENFSRVEKEINNVAATENVFVMSSVMNDSNNSGEQEDDYVFSLLTSKEKQPSSDTENTIESALRSAMDAKPNTRVEEKEEEEEEEEEVYESNGSVPESVTSNIGAVGASEKREPVDKETLEKFLKKANSDNESKLERQWRERKAYEWSSNMVNGSGSLESKTFFDPLFAKSAGFPMFPPAKKREHDFLVLTSNGATFTSGENPLGSSHVPEDMFDILERLSEGELAKFSKSLKKLQKQEWKLIGGGGKGDKKMLVLRRGLRYRSPTLWSRVKSLLGAVVVVFFTLVGLNYWLEAKGGVPEDSVTSSEDKSSIDSTSEHTIMKIIDDLREKKDYVIAEAESSLTNSEVPQGKLWKQLFWR